MPAYLRLTVDEFLNSKTDSFVGALELAHAQDGFSTQFSSQIRAWATILSLLKTELTELRHRLPTSSEWSLLFEFPLYRLRKRIDVVLLTKSTIVVLETKVGQSRFLSTDQRQVEEYALDLRDFHAESHGRQIVPVLWCTQAEGRGDLYPRRDETVAPVQLVGKTGLARLLESFSVGNGAALVAETWDKAAYRPVPSVIQAATSVFSGHGVQDITQANATNLKDAAARVVEIIRERRAKGGRAIIFLTGVPGSGKTLAGLQVVHDAVATGTGNRGDTVYLSGNTPLVTVLREALARDDYARKRGTEAAITRDEARRRVRARIQHVNDFLKQNVDSKQPPHEHAIVFDEAQRAWDEEQGKKKFERDASEPSLLLEIMGRHPDWSVCVCLVGGGQEINSGEKGVEGWGDAIRGLAPDGGATWAVFAPRDVLQGGSSTAGLAIGALPPTVRVSEETELQLEVPMRTYRSPLVGDWVAAVLRGDQGRAASLKRQIQEYPIMLTRSLEQARSWTTAQTRGQRRSGLLASSGARRLRADGLGAMLSAMDGQDIAHWYLNEPGDIRSSHMLEVPANEYACQGLEIDFGVICWGGDFLRNSENTQWMFRRLGGPSWKDAKSAEKRRFITNAYRVLLTRCREGMVIWMPEGSEEDGTRDIRTLSATAEFLQNCGLSTLI